MQDVFQWHYSSYNMTIPRDASVALSLSHCGFCAALLAQNAVSPAQQIITSQQILKQIFNVMSLHLAIGVGFLQSCPWDLWAHPLLSFCSQSEPRSKSEAPSGPSPSFYDVYPAETDVQYFFRLNDDYMIHIFVMETLETLENTKHWQTISSLTSGGF